MTQKDKNLLLKDLCARLYYNPMVCAIGWEGPIRINNLNINRLLISTLDPPKPYLRPMKSMTEKEREHLQLLHDIISDENYGDGFSPTAWETISEFNDYCCAHHLDNRGLIGKGLALEAPDNMYK